MGTDNNTILLLNNCYCNPGTDIWYFNYSHNIIITAIIIIIPILLMKKQAQRGELSCLPSHSRQVVESRIS